LPIDLALPLRIRGEQGIQMRNPPPGFQEWLRQARPQGAHHVLFSLMGTAQIQAL
jgi:hypothetical protein